MLTCDLNPEDCSFQTCIIQLRTFNPNLRTIGLLVIVQLSTKVISTSVDGRTDITDDNNRLIFLKRKNTKNEDLYLSYVSSSSRLLGYTGIPIC